MAEPLYLSSFSAVTWAKNLTINKMSHLPSKALGPTVYERLSFMFYYFSKIGAADRASKDR